MKEIFFSLILIFAVNLSAAIINIPADQPTIQAGINFAAQNDTILVEPGSYNTGLDFLGKSLTLASLFLTTGEADYISMTSIDGYSTAVNNILLLNVGEPESKLIGLSIEMLDIYLESSKLIIENCEINAANSNALTIFYDSEVSIRSSKIHGIRFGKAIMANSSDLEIINTLFYDNGGYGGNGGIAVTGCDLKIINSVIVESNPDIGWSDQAITCSGSNLILFNSIMWDNAYGNISIGNGSNVAIANSCLQSGEASISGDLASLAWLEGNIASSPDFVNLADGDLALSNQSLCIGAGSTGLELSGEYYQAPAYDIINNPRPNPVGSNPDIGAFESELAEPILASEPELFIVSRLNNYPNPFNPSTSIEFSLAEESKVTVAIYNIKGQLIKTVINNEYLEGTCSAIWNGDDEAGNTVSSGVYYYKLTIDGKRGAIRKCLLLK